MVYVVKQSHPAVLPKYAVKCIHIAQLMATHLYGKVSLLQIAQKHYGRLVPQKAYMTKDSQIFSKKYCTTYQL